MIEKYLRPLYQKVAVCPALSIIEKYTDWMPSHITFLSVVFGLVSAVFISFHSLWLSSIFLLLSGYCDTLDGSLARQQNTSSAKGAVLDIVGDRVVEAAIIFGLFLVAPQVRGITALLMLASCMICVTTFLVVGLFVDNNSSKSFYYSDGLIERPEAFVFFIMMIWLPNWFVVLSVVFSILVLWTSVVRVCQFLWGNRVFSN